MSVKIEKSSWSKPFAVDAVGTSGIVKCAYKGAAVSKHDATVGKAMIFLNSKIDYFYFNCILMI